MQIAKTEACVGKLINMIDFTRSPHYYCNHSAVYTVIQVCPKHTYIHTHARTLSEIHKQLCSRSTVDQCSHQWQSVTVCILSSNSFGTENVLFWFSERWSLTLHRSKHADVATGIWITHCPPPPQRSRQSPRRQRLAVGLGKNWPLGSEHRWSCESVIRAVSSSPSFSLSWSLLLKWVKVISASASASSSSSSS